MSTLLHSDVKWLNTRAGAASYYTYAVHAVSVLGTILWRKGRDVCLNLHPRQCAWNSQKKSWAISMSSNNCAKSDTCRRSRTSKMNNGVSGHDLKFHLWSSHKDLLTVLHWEKKYELAHSNNICFWSVVQTQTQTESSIIKNLFPRGRTAMKGIIMSPLVINS